LNTLKNNPLNVYDGVFILFENPKELFEEMEMSDCKSDLVNLVKDGRIAFLDVGSVIEARTILCKKFNNVNLESFHFLSFPNILALAFVKNYGGDKCREVRCPSFSCSGVCRYSSLEIDCYNYLAEQETDDKTVFVAILC